MQIYRFQSTSFPGSLLGNRFVIQFIAINAKHLFSAKGLGTIATCKQYGGKFEFWKDFFLNSAGFFKRLGHGQAGKASDYCTCTEGLKLHSIRCEMDPM